MKLIFPKDKTQFNPNQLPIIPTRFGTESACHLIAMAQDGTDLYVTFTNEDRKEVWIEKASVFLTAHDHLVAEMLERIEDEQEFTMAHQFFLKEGILDARKNE